MPPESAEPTADETTALPGDDNILGFDPDGGSDYPLDQGVDPPAADPAATEAPTTDAPAVDETKPSEPLRDEAGRFAPAQPAVADPPAFQMPEKFAGKSPEDIAAAYAELEAKLGQRPELTPETVQAQVNAALEQQRQAFETQMATHMQQLTPSAPVLSRVDALASAVTHPAETFLHAMEHQPELVPSIIALVGNGNEEYDGNPEMAESMRMAWAERKVQQQFEEATKPLEQLQQSHKASEDERIVTGAYNQFLVDNPDVAQLGPQFAEAITENSWALTDKSPEGINKFLGLCARLAKHSLAPQLEQVAAQTQQQNVHNKAVAAFTETGTAPAASPQAGTGDEAEAKQVLADMFAAPSIYT